MDNHKLNVDEQERDHAQNSPPQAQVVDQEQDANQFSNINYFHNIEDVQNVVNAVNSALSVDLSNLDSNRFQNNFEEVNIDPSISNSDRKLHSLRVSNNNTNNTNLNDESNSSIINPSRNNVGSSSNNTRSSNDNISLNQITMNHHQLAHEPEVDDIDKFGKFEIPSGVDPKKICPFCGRTFSHPGSLGRHLDLKKGSRLHPEDEINRMRANVKRRGDKVEIKTRRKLKSKEYNAREEVKERNRIRRRFKDRRIKAKDISQTSFLSKLGTPSLQPHPTFARIVLYFLPPSQWPHDPPTMETYRQLTNLLDPSAIAGSASMYSDHPKSDDTHQDHIHEQNQSGQEHQPQGQSQQIDSIIYSDYITKLQAAFENWLTLSHSTKQEIWIREQRRTAEDALGSLSLFDLATKDLWIQDEERRHFVVLTRDQRIEDATKDNENKDDGREDDDGEDEDDKRSEDEDSYYHGNESVAFAAVAAAVAHNID